MYDLLYVLLIFLLELPSPFLGTRAATLVDWHDAVRHTEGLFEAAILTTASF